MIMMKIPIRNKGKLDYLVLACSRLSIRSGERKQRMGSGSEEGGLGREEPSEQKGVFLSPPPHFFLVRPVLWPHQLKA